MDKQDAIKCLKSMQQWIPDWDDREDGLSYWDAIDMAIAALSPPNEPLTLEQLREMDGEPVFLVFNFELEPMISLIEYVQVTDCIILTNNLGGRSEFCSDEELREYGIKAYAYPPVATDTDVGCKLDEWTAEWIKNDGYTECSKCEHWYDSPENEDDGDRPAFCPSCGRAMTPGAWAMLEKRLRG